MNIEINDIKDLFKERKDNANKGNFALVVFSVVL